jgi:Flp pilus assembly pilin Flp
MTKFINSQAGSANVESGLVIALVCVIFAGLTNVHSKIPTGINNLNAALVQQR